MSEQEHTVAFTGNTADIIQAQRLTEATSQIEYVSQGHCLVIGEPGRALSLQETLRSGGMTVVQINPAASKVDRHLTEDGIAVFTVPELLLDGYLGAYRAVVPANPVNLATEFDLGVAVFRETGLFDVVLDLSERPFMPMKLPPFGYIHVDENTSADTAAAELGELQGEFEKPRYFQYDAAICAHSRSELQGCSRCLDVCATDAIVSSGEGISVNPFLCQGCGSCTTVCPSGAISYAFPRPRDAISKSRQTLQQKQVKTLLLHSEAEQSIVDDLVLNESLAAMLVEEVSAFGADYWLAALAGPANRIIVLLEPGKDPLAQRALESQLAWLSPLLTALQVNEMPVSLVSPAQLPQALALSESASGLSSIDPDSAQTGLDKGLDAIHEDFDTHNDKRQTIRLSLDALSTGLKPIDASAALPAIAPFGRINVNKDACTLCMACVSTCPAKALLDGQDTPALRFIEANCLQCGLCEQACPESAISLESRYLWDSIEARKVETLHAEEPFHCVNCHTPFATKAMIENMGEKLSGHWMFQDKQAVRRLKLCGDCRVRDMFESDAGGIAVHKD